MKKIVEFITNLFSKKKEKIYIIKRSNIWVTINSFDIMNKKEISGDYNVTYIDDNKIKTILIDKKTLLNKKDNLSEHSFICGCSSVHELIFYTLDQVKAEELYQKESIKVSANVKNYEKIIFDKEKNKNDLELLKDNTITGKELKDYNRSVNKAKKNGPNINSELRKQLSYILNNELEKSDKEYFKKLFNNKL